MRQYCVDVTGTTPEEIWEEIRLVYGPTNFDYPPVLEMRDNDILAWNTWVAENSSIPFNVWLLWKLSIGTEDVGSLPKTKKHLNKVGHSYAPCPYSTQSNDVRTRHMLNLSDTDPLPMKVDHSILQVVYYMETAYSGRWGFQCSYGPLCPGYTNGIDYIYV